MTKRGKIGQPSRDKSCEHPSGSNIDQTDLENESREQLISPLTANGKLVRSHRLTIHAIWRCQSQWGWSEANPWWVWCVEPRGESDFTGWVSYRNGLRLRRFGSYRDGNNQFSTESSDATAEMVEPLVKLVRYLGQEYGIEYLRGHLEANSSQKSGERYCPGNEGNKISATNTSNF